jgi:tRNA (guanine-N7-)-methyltransferase
MSTDQNRRRINLTRTLPRQNAYTLALDGEFSAVAFNEERAPLNKGLWRSKIFEKEKEALLDLEIGTGNGTFFAHQAQLRPERLLIGMELKYKPLVQSIRRAVKQGSKNVAICRYHSFNLDLLFEAEELNDIYIHFPDPWVAPRKPKNRTVNAELLKVMYGLQRPGSKIYFKTDSREYYDWSLEQIPQTPYKIEATSTNLHQSPWASTNFLTAFEKIFMRQNIPINYMVLAKS